jgi:hypothetical protein
MCIYLVASMLNRLLMPPLLGKVIVTRASKLLLLGLSFGAQYLVSAAIDHVSIRHYSTERFRGTSMIICSEAS